jgi:tRNA A-37 threonylcarbamoyl transferase component Bud32
VGGVEYLQARVGNATEARHGHHKKQCRDRVAIKARAFGIIRQNDAVMQNSFALSFGNDMSNQQNGVANCGAYYAVRAGRYSGINYIHKVLNARYAHLEGFVLNIPERFAGIETIIQNYRNDIRVCTVNDSRLVIKSFKGMYFTNQLAYSLFRKSKARRSYENALQLLSRGVNVPAPVAFIDCYRFFFLTESFFISEYQPHTSFNDMLADERNKQTLLTSFAAFTFNLHRAGIYHSDYSNGNILCNNAGGQVAFSLVDLNRVRFTKVSYARALESFSKLSLSVEDLAVVVKRYAELSGRSPGNELAAIMNLKIRRTRIAKWKTWAKTIFYPSRRRREKAASI